MSTKTTAVALLIQLLLIATLCPAQQSTSMSERFVDTQGGLSLDEAIRQALAGEPGLQAVRADINASEGKREQADLRPNPSVSVEYRGEPRGTDNQTMAQLQWPLELFRRGPRVEVASREVEVSQRAADDRARLVAGAVRSRYGNAAAAVRDLALADQAVDLMTRQFALVRQRAEDGAVPPIERDQLEVELRRYEAERIFAVGRVDVAFVELKRAMGVGPEVPIQLRDVLDVLAASPVGTPAAGGATGLQGDGPGNRADVQMVDAQLRLAASKVSRAASDGRFDISLFGGYTRMDSGFPQRGFGESGMIERVRGVFHYLSIGAMVTLPLNNDNRGDVAAASAEEAGVKFRLQEAQLTAQAEVAAAQAREQAARRALVITRSTVALAARNLDVVRQAYELGRTTVSDVLTEQRRSLDVEREYTETMRAAYEAHAAVLLARGER